MRDRDLIYDIALGESTAALPDIPHAARLHDAVRRMVSSLAVPRYQASSEAVARAKAIWPSAATRLNPVATTLAGVGARSTATAGFQSVFESGGRRLRLLVTPTRDGYELRGELTGVPCGVFLGDDEVGQSPDGRFVALTPDLDVELRLVAPDFEAIVPLLPNP